MIVTLGIWGYVWTYRQHRDIKDYSGAGVGGGIGLLIYFLFSPATYFLLPSEIANDLYHREGRSAPVSGMTGFWLFLPLLGSLIWYLKLQGALNDFWVAHGAARP